MSWHMSGLVIQRATSESEYRDFLEILELKEPEYRLTASFDDAIDELTEEGVAIACAEGWTSVWGNLLLVSERVLEELSQDANAFTFMMEGTSGCYSFEWWTEGVRKRKWLSIDGEVSIDEGQSIPEEIEAFEEESDDEDRIFSLMEKLTIPYRQLTAPEFHVFRVADEFGFS